MVAEKVELAVFTLDQTLLPDEIHAAGLGVGYVIHAGVIYALHFIIGDFA